MWCQGISESQPFTKIGSDCRSNEIGFILKGGKGGKNGNNSFIVILLFLFFSFPFFIYLNIHYVNRI